MPPFQYTLKSENPARLGLIVLQSDERIEADFRRLIPGSLDVFVSRVPSGTDVTPETLQSMEKHLTASANLLPQAQSFDVIGYGCTSGSAQIGPDAVAANVKQGIAARTVTNPLTALVQVCKAAGITRLGFLSPYVESVSARLRNALDTEGIETPVFGSFDEAEEALVARISPASITAAGADLAHSGDMDALFLSCTNLDTLDIIEPLQHQIGVPVLSSNLVLAWHMCHLVGADLADIPATRHLLRACPLS